MLPCSNHPGLAPSPNTIIIQTRPLLLHHVPKRGVSGYPQATVLEPMAYLNRSGLLVQTKIFLVQTAADASDSRSPRLQTIYCARTFVGGANNRVGGRG